MKLIIVVLIGLIIIGLTIGINRGWISAFSQDVQSFSKDKFRPFPRALKVVIVALVVVRLVFSFSSLGDRPYNADEVRGFYRLSGYQRLEVLEDVFRGEILSTQEIQLYQRTTGDKNLGDALSSLANNPEHPPLYYLLARFWMQIWNQPVSARILSILLGIAYLPFAYWLCLELFSSTWAGWIAVALLSISPYHILLTLGAREYSLWILLILVSSLSLLRALRLRNYSSWAVYAATVGVGFYSHLFFVFLLASHGIYALIYDWQKDWKRWYKSLVPFIISSAMGLLTFSPWIVVIASNLNTVTDNTQWVRNRESSLSSIALNTIDNIGNIFIDFDNTTPFESSLDRLVLLFIILVLYCLIYNNPTRIWSFLELSSKENLKRCHGRPRYFLS